METNTKMKHLPAIIQLGGTFGAGKSTLVQMALRASLPAGAEMKPEGSSPFIRFDFEGVPCSVMGDYTLPTPGTDPLLMKAQDPSMSAADWVMREIMAESLKGRRVLWECVMMVAIARLEELRDAVNGRYYPLVLDLPMEVCFRGQEERRQRRAWARGRPAQEAGENNDANTRGKIRGHLSTLGKLGTPLLRVETRQEGWAFLRRLLSSRIIDEDAKYLLNVDRTSMDYKRWVATETAAAEFRELAQFPVAKPPNRQVGLF